jgi:O-antigen/teichoic acid export membrane protein
MSSWAEPVVPQRVRRRFTAVFVGRGLIAARQVMIIPLMLRAWGADYYGAWLILSSIPTFMAMSNLGVGTSARSRGTLEVAAGHISEARSTIKLGTTIVAAVGLIAVLVGYVGVNLFSEPQSPLHIVEHASAVVAVLMATTFIQMLAAPLDAVWIGSGRAAFSQNSFNLLNIATIASMAGLLSMGSSAITMSLVLLTITVLWAGTYIFLSRRALALLSLDNDRPVRRPNPKRNVVDLVWQGLGYQAGSLWQAILFQGSIVVAGTLLGTAGAALWGSMRAVVRSGNQFLELIGQTAAPEFQLAYAQKNYDKLGKDYRLALLAGLAVASSMVVFLLIFGRPIFDWWTHNSFHLSYSAWTVLCLSLLPYSLWWNGGVLQLGVNRPWLVNVYGVGSAALSVGLMRVFGSGGIVFFSACALLFDSMMAAFVLPHSWRMLAKVADNAG